MTQQDDLYLYHYTTLDAFISIVKTQEIWASNIFYLNDSAEYHWSVDLARELLEALTREETDEARKQTLGEIRGHLEDVRPGMITRPIFAWCFSEEPDDLSQWRAYGPNGGVAVGFQQAELQNLATKQGKRGPGFVPELVKCIYQETEQRQLILDCIKQAAMAEPQGSSRYRLSPRQVNEVRASLLEGTLVRRPIKHPKFENEQEWRLVMLPDPDIEAGPDVEPRLGFRGRNGLVIPYWRFDLDPDKDKRIWRNVRVTIGPSPHPHELKNSVESLLKHYCRGPDEVVPWNVKNSRVPYRYW
jgi:hypothetical protein